MGLPRAMTTDPFTIVSTAWCVIVLARSCLYDLFDDSPPA